MEVRDLTLSNVRIESALRSRPEWIGAPNTGKGKRIS